MVSSEPYFYKILMDALEKELRSPVGIIPQSIIMVILIHVMILLVVLFFHFETD